MSEEASPPKEVKLQHAWVLSYDEQSGRSLQKEQYDEGLKQLGTFQTVQEFWRYWNNLHVENFPNNSNLRVFKQGIHPSWEDPANAQGGKWSIDVVEGKATHAFMLTLLSLIGETFVHSDEMCGAVLSIRHQGNRINVWNRTARGNPEMLAKCEQELRQVLKSIKIINMRYQPHRIDVPPSSTAMPSKTAQQQASAAASASVPAPLAGGATDPVRIESINSTITTVAAATNSGVSPRNRSPPNNDRSALTASQGDDDDFESPFLDLNDELDEKKGSPKSDSPPSARGHRKSPSTGAAQHDGLGPLISTNGAAALDAAAMKRRLRRRGSRQSGSGNHRAAVAQALASNSDSAEVSPRESKSPEVPSSASPAGAPLQSSGSSPNLTGLDQIMTPSITERKYLQRKRSVDRSSSRTSSKPGSRSRDRSAEEPGLGRSAIIFAFLFFCLIMTLGLFSHFACDSWGIYCT